MNKNVLYSALGFGAGVFVGWSVAADIFDKKFKEEQRTVELAFYELEALESQIKGSIVTQPAEVSELNQRNDDQLSLINVNINNVLEPETKVSEEVSEEAEDEPQETEEETRTNLQRIIDSYTADDDAQAAWAEHVAEAEEHDKAPPFVISRDDYAFDEEGKDFEKITLSYYPNDNVLLDDDDEPMDNIIQLVGWKNLSKFGQESHDPDVVFVRNRRLKTDFEIVKDDENPLPLHVKYGMQKEEFRANKAAGLIKLRQEDE